MVFEFQLLPSRKCCSNYPLLHVCRARDEETWKYTTMYQYLTGIGPMLLTSSRCQPNSGTLWIVYRAKWAQRYFKFNNTVHFFRLKFFQTAFKMWQVFLQQCCLSTNRAQVDWYTVLSWRPQHCQWGIKHSFKLAGIARDMVSWSKYISWLVTCNEWWERRNALCAHVTGGNFHRFKGHWQFPPMAQRHANAYRSGSARGLWKSPASMRCNKKWECIMSSYIKKTFLVATGGGGGGGCGGGCGGGWGGNNRGYPPAAHLQLKSRQISFVHTIYPSVLSIKSF